VLGAAYMLWLYQRTMFGTCDNPKNQILKDLNFREIMTLAPLIVWAFWIGLYPKPFFKVLDQPVTAIVQKVNPQYFARGGQDKPAAPAAQRQAPAAAPLALSQRLPMRGDHP
jgi:NADH-quinone oxidoreductase subunit M